MGLPRSVQNLLEKVGDLRGILEILVQSNWHFSNLLLYTKSGQTVSDYHPLLLNFEYIFALFKSQKKFSDVLFVVGLVFSRSSLIFYYRKTQECELKIGIVHVCNLVFDRDLCSKVYCMIIDYVPQRLKPITL